MITLVPIEQGGTAADNASDARTNLGASTVGANLFTLSNPSAITFLQLNADNSVSPLSASAFRTAIGAGTGAGTVTSVSGTASRITSTGGTTPVLDISATFEALLGKVANPLSQFAATTSAQLASIISDETGSGVLVFNNAPTLIGAILGSSTATTQSPSDNSTKLATTAYVDNAILGQDFKQAVGAATTTVLASYIYNNGTSGVGATITLVATGVISFDGVSLTSGMRVLVKNETTTNRPNNGIYTVTVAGAIGVALVLTRTTDFDQSSDVDTGDSVFVTSGTTQGTTTWAYNGVNNPTFGTDNITFAQTAGQGSFTAGNGISITGVSIAIDTSVTVDKNTVQTLTNKTITGTFTGGLTGNASTATALQNARTFWGQSFDGTANVTGDITLGTSNITMTGFLSATGARVTKGWFTDIESTNMPTVGAVSLSSIFSVTALSNLSSVAINTSLLPGTDGAIDVGSSSKQYKRLYLWDGGSIIWNNTVSIDSSGGVMEFSGGSGYHFDNKIYPATNDGAALGFTSSQWSDLFLATGGVINWGNGNMTLTHSATLLTLSGGGFTMNGNLVGVINLGLAGARVTKGWFTDLQVTNAIAGSITGNAATVSNATFSTALTVNTGTLTLTAAAANTSVLTVGAGAVSVSGSNTGDQTTISGNAGTATALQNSRTLWGQSFNGTGNVTGDITLSTANITMTGSLAATGARVTKGWFTDIESTNMPTVGGVSLSTTFAPKASPTFTGTVTLPTGGASAAPLLFVAGTNLTTAGAGAMEFDGVAFYATSAASSRQVVHTEQFITLTSNFTTPGGTTALQKIFNAPTNGTVTLAANTTYFFELSFSVSGLSATSGNFAVGFGGTATLTSIAYMMLGTKNVITGNNANINFYNVAAASNVAASNNTATAGNVFCTGKITVTTGGTFIPQFSSSVAIASIIAAGAFFRIWPAGSNTIQSIGNWS